MAWVEEQYPQLMSETIMDWVNRAKKIFYCEKPQHFTNYRHCEECQEHDETLIGSSIDSISLEELGNPGWDPICFCGDEGKKYYMPAFIRLSLETMDSNDFYLEQFLFHLEGDGKENSLFLSCNKQQRDYIVKFLEYVINSFTEQIEHHYCVNEILTVHEIWSDVIVKSVD